MKVSKGGDRNSKNAAWNAEWFQMERALGRLFHDLRHRATLAEVLVHELSESLPKDRRRTDNSRALERLERTISFMREKIIYGSILLKGGRFRVFDPVKLLYFATELYSDGPIRLHTKANTSTGMVHCNFANMVAIISALMENSIEAGASRVFITLDSADDCKGHRKVARLKIADDGPGIDRRMADKVFSEWFSTRRGSQGLGLCIAKILAFKNGCDLRLKFDEKPTSSTFVLDIPVNESSTEA